MSKGPRILTADIETLPLQTYTWSLFDEPRALDRIVKDWAIFSGAAKWFRRDEVMYMDTREQPHPENDYELVKWLCSLLNKADIVVGQNLQKFDMRKIRARALHHGLPPFREPEVVDTMLMAKELGAFTSNKLEYLSGNLTDIKKDGHEEFPGFKLWLGILANDPRAWEAVKEYNITDVRSTEELYIKLRPWARRHPNIAHYWKDDKLRCPRCGSVRLKSTGLIHKGVSTYMAYKCGGCGGHSRTRYTLNKIEKRRALLSTL